MLYILTFQALANQLNVSDQRLEKIFEQQAIELHVQKDERKKFQNPNADYADGTQVVQTSKIITIIRLLLLIPSRRDLPGGVVIQLKAQ